jgi:tetratricopeptide (TPR) repeat protein
MGRSAFSAWYSVPPVAVGLALVVGLGMLIGGCGRGSFVGRQYDDFTAYYNTYHNAEAAFEKGRASLSRGTDRVDRAQYISVFATPQAGAGQNAFEQTIQKSADVLRTHPNSKWVDDALMLIGRARYYRQNYVGAAQKFREVLALDGERAAEARFRLARTLLAAERYPEAMEVLRAGLDPAAGAGPWAARLQLVQGELAVRQERWADAEAALERGLQGDLPDAIGARAAFLLGQVHETQGQYAEARTAYRQVLDYDPRYQLAFAARLGAHVMHGRAGAPGAALGRLEAVERGDNSDGMRGQIARVRARLYQLQDRPAQARAVLRDALRGEAVPQGTVRGRLHYALATLYRDAYEDFTNAAAHYDTAATALSRTGRRSQVDAPAEAAWLPDAPTDATVQADRYRTIAEHSQAIARMDSLLRLGQMPPAAFRAEIETIRKQRRAAQEQAAERRREQQFRRAVGQRSAPAEQASRAQSLAAQTRQSDAGFLFHRAPTLLQQGRRQFRETWGERRLVDNWRRVNAIQGTSAEAPAPEQSRETAGPPGQNAAAGEVGIDVSAVPRDSARQADMKQARVAAQYELADALYRAAGRPDSAETWFRRVMEMARDTLVAQRALYGLAQAHGAQGDSAAARAAFRQLLERHPATPYARRAREQLGMEVAEAQGESPTSRADSLYTRAYRAWQDDAPRAALEQFLALAESHPEAAVAPRALLAAGVVYHREVQPDSSTGPPARLRRVADSLAPNLDLSPAEAMDASREDASAAARPPQTAPSPNGAPVKQAAVPDSTRPPPTADTTASPPESRTPASVSRPLLPDSASAPPARPDTAQADSLRTATPVRPPQQVLFAHLVQQYPNTPVATRAQHFLDYLRAQSADPPAADSAAAADSLARPRPDSGRAAPTPPPDTTAAESPTTP